MTRKNHDEDCAGIVISTATPPLHALKRANLERRWRAWRISPSQRRSRAAKEIHSRVKSGDADEVRTRARYRTPLVGLRAFTSDATAPDIPGGAVPTLPASPRARDPRLPPPLSPLQDTVDAGVAALRRAVEQIDRAGVFSPDETAEDIPTAHLKYALAPFYLAEILTRVRASEPSARLPIVTETARHHADFLALCRRRELLPARPRRGARTRRSCRPRYCARREGGEI